MVYGFTKGGGSKAVLEAIDQISVHMLPYFSSECPANDLLNLNGWFLIMGCNVPQPRRLLVPMLGLSLRVISTGP
jgi:hypothetical protein